MASNPTSHLDVIESELGKLHFIVPDVVMDELMHIQAVAGPKRSMIARSAIHHVHSNFKVVKFKRSRQVDDAIVAYARTNKCAAATLDKNLKKRLIGTQILVFTLSKNRITIANTRRY